LAAFGVADMPPVRCAMGDTVWAAEDAAAFDAAAGRSAA
jgi:hypothetical protein